MVKVRSQLFAMVDLLSRTQKQSFLLILDIVLAPLALFITCQLMLNEVYPAAIVAETWTIFGILPVVAALLSSAIGIPKIKLKAYESLAVLTTALFAALLSLCVLALQSVLDVPFPTAGLILFALVFFLLSVGVRVAMLHVFL